MFVNICKGWGDALRYDDLQEEDLDCQIWRSRPRCLLPPASGPRSGEEYHTVSGAPQPPVNTNTWTTSLNLTYQVFPQNGHWEGWSTVLFNHEPKISKHLLCTKKFFLPIIYKFFLQCWNNFKHTFLYKCISIDQLRGRTLIQMKFKSTKYAIKHHL